jgi:hypothetical protein
VTIAYLPVAPRFLPSQRIATSGTSMAAPQTDDGAFVVGVEVGWLRVGWVVRVGRGVCVGSGEDVGPGVLESVAVLGGRRVSVGRGVFVGVGG